MLSNEIRARFLKFFENRGHSIIPSASLVPENDPSTLFNTAGMQPLVPYLLGQPHPKGTRLVDCQKCVRTGDIDDVGDNRHLTFFEMLGNWSLGDYFKQEAINWSLEFLTNKEEGLGLDINRLYVTVFKGLPATGGAENGIPRDEEAISVWKEAFAKLGITAEVAGEDEQTGGNIRIIPLGVDDNFWIAGTTGPCGGDTEMFYDTRPEEGPLSGNFGDLVDSFRLIEVWNDVFMEFNKTADGKYEPLTKKNVDTGMGLERTTAVVNGHSTVFDTDLFEPVLTRIDSVVNQDKEDKRSKRIVADHIRTAVFMIADGVIPSNTDQGYILRRILRRAVRYSDVLGLPTDYLIILAQVVIDQYASAYPELIERAPAIKNEIAKEEKKFRETLEKGLREFEKGRNPFDLYQSFGFPIELAEELAKEKGLTIDRTKFDEEMKKHQELSRQGAEQKFKGGLGGSSEQIVKYHTATHLLQQALVDVLGPEVAQKGSNITEERLRFDFAWPAKMTDEQKAEVEKIVNEKITANLPVNKVILSKDEAEKTGARHLFSEKYGDEVSIYFIGDSLDTAYSKEFCGGPHVENTGILGHFKITKEEAVAAGVRRIKAVLENPDIQDIKEWA